MSVTLRQSSRVLTLTQIIGPSGESVYFTVKGIWVWKRAIQRRCGAMQQLRTPLKTIAHGLTVSDRDRSQLDEAGRFYLVGQTAKNVTYRFLNRDFPRVSQRSGDRFYRFTPFVLIALIGQAVDPARHGL